MEFIYEGEKYNIIEADESEEAKDAGYQLYISDVVRESKLFALRPRMIKGKFRWLRKITILESLQFARFLDIGDNYLMVECWSPWKKTWIEIEIVD